MSRIAIHRTHNLPLADARAVIEKISARMQEKFGMQGHWDADVLRFSRPGVNGSIDVTADAIQVNAELSMMLSPLKGMVEQEIQRKLDEHFS